MSRRFIILIAIITLCSFNIRNTEYFFFEIRPTRASTPCYISQTISISYNDYNDLVRQQAHYFHELMVAAAFDGIDTLGYKCLMPPGSDDREKCEAIRLSEFGSLSADSTNVVYKQIIE
jgi:hypothetical protein